MKGTTRKREEDKKKQFGREKREGNEYAGKRNEKKNKLLGNLPQCKPIPSLWAASG